MPISLLLLALFGLLIGAWGVVSEGMSLFESEVEEESFSDMLARLEGEAPLEQKDAIAAFRKSPEMIGQVEDIFASLDGLLPMPGVYRTANLIFAVMALAAGIGILKRKDWGRKLEIGFIVAATLFAGGYGYFLVPGIGRLAANLAQTMGAGNSIEPSSLESSLYLGWTLLVLLFVLLHGLIVWYLMRPSVRDVFSEETR